MGRISEFQVIKRAAVPALVVKSQIPLKDLPQEMEESKEKLEAYLQLIDQYPAGPFYVRYHSFSKEKVDMEAGFPVPQIIAGEEEVEPAEVEADIYLTALHLGPHKQIPKLYQEMDEWLAEHQWETAGVSEEVYLNALSEGVEPEQLAVFVMIPIQKV